MKTVNVGNTSIGTGMPKICVPLVGTTKQELIEEAKQLRTISFDIAEWRADFFVEIEDIAEVQDTLRKIRQILPEIPLIFTFRSLREGGEKEIQADAYIELNKTMIESGKVDFIDIELFNQEETVQIIQNHAHDKGVYTIVSNHDFQQTPEKDEIIARLKKAQELGADLPKIAVMPNNTKDVLTLLDATREMHEKYADRPIITMSMAGKGIISRLGGEIFGSAITFGTAQKASAPGQVPVSELQQTLKLIHNNLS